MFPSQAHEGMVVSNPLVKDVPKDLVISSLSLRLLDPVGQGIVPVAASQPPIVRVDSFLILLFCCFSFIMKQCEISLGSMHEVSKDHTCAVKILGFNVL